MMLSTLEEIQSLNIMGVELLEEGNYSEAAAAFSCCLSHLSCCSNPTTPPASFCLKSSMLLDGGNHLAATDSRGGESLNSSSTTTAPSSNSATPCWPNSSAPTTTTANTTIAHPVPTQLLQHPNAGTSFRSDSFSGQPQLYYSHHSTMAYDCKNYLGYPTYPNTVCPHPTTTNTPTRKKNAPSFVIHVYCEEEDMLDPRSEYFGHPFLFEYFDHYNKNNNCKCRYNVHWTPCCSLVGPTTPPEVLQQPSGHLSLLQCRGTAATTTNKVKNKTEAQNGDGFDGSCFHRSGQCETCPHDQQKHQGKEQAQQLARPDATHQNDNEGDEAEDKDDSHGFVLTNSQHAAITICCLFNLALCHHLEWERGQRTSIGLLESALSLYHYAFLSYTQPLQSHYQQQQQQHGFTTTLMDPGLNATTRNGNGEGHHKAQAFGRHSAGATTAASSSWLQNFCSPSDSVLKVLMAICTNATQCHVELVAGGCGGDSSPKQVSCWNQILNHILHYCHARDLYHPAPEETILLKEGRTDCVRFSSYCTEQQPQQHDDTRMTDNNNDQRVSNDYYGNHGDDDDDDDASGSWPSCHDFFTLHAFLNSLPQQIARAA
ncbi:hypothetical protein ACA910_001996 [Epithemia clementina (nom. ined.)]